MAAGVTGTTFQAQQAQAPGAPLASVAQAAAAAVTPAAAPVAAVAAAVVAPAATQEVVLHAQAETAASDTVIKAAAHQVQQQDAADPAPGDRQASEQYYAQLREQLRWVPVQVGERKLATPDVPSRLLLAQSAAEVADLEEVGLDFRDVYGVINAETTWVPRTGMGKNGVASLGLAQFEPATARAVGLRNPNDAVEAVHAAAVLLKEAAAWSARRIAPLNLSPEQHAVKLREGISIYYNLSTKARQGWSGANTHKLPIETRRHIRNVRVGAQQAGQLLQRVGDVDLPPAVEQVAWTRPAPAAAAPVKLARATPKKAAPQQLALAAQKAGPIKVTERNGRKTWTLPQGSISWSTASRS